MSDFLLFTKKFLAEKYDVNSSSFKTSYSITKSFINRHLDLFEPKSKKKQNANKDENLDANKDEYSKNSDNISTKSTQTFLKNASKILKIIEDSNASDETKRKLLLFFALLLKKLNEHDLHVKYLKTYRKIKYNIIDERKSSVPRGYKEIQCLGVSLQKLRNVPININELDAKTLLYNLLVYIDETPRLDYRSLIYNPSTSNKQSSINHLNYMKNYKDKSGNDCNIMIVLNDYKTYKKYGTWTIKINHTKLCEYINKYINHHKLKANEYIFLNANHKPFTSNKFSEFVQNIFKKKVGIKISINCLRILKENQLFHQNPQTLNWSLKEKEKWVVQYFRHSLATSRLYYQRIKHNDSNNNTPKHTQNDTEISGLTKTKSFHKKKHHKKHNKKHYRENKSLSSTSAHNNNDENGGNSESITESIKQHKYKANKMISFTNELNELMQKYNVGKPQVRKLISKEVLI